MPMKCFKLKTQNLLCPTLIFGQTSFKRFRPLLRSNLLIRKMCCIIYELQSNRVARWFVFKPKIPIWVNFKGPRVDWKMVICISYGHLEYFVFIWYIFPDLVSCTNENLATLQSNHLNKNLHTMKAWVEGKKWFHFWIFSLHKKTQKSPTKEILG
jgi:hypothetical protein